MRDTKLSFRNAESQAAANTPTGTAVHSMQRVQRQDGVRSMETAGGRKRIKNNVLAIRAWQMVKYEKLARSKLDDDAKIILVIREAPTTLSENLLVNSHQLEGEKNQFGIVTQSYLNSNKKCTVGDFRNEVKTKSWELRVHHISREGKVEGNGQEQKKRRKVRPTSNGQRLVHVRIERSLSADHRSRDASRRKTSQ